MARALQAHFILISRTCAPNAQRIRKVDESTSRIRDAMTLYQSHGGQVLDTLFVASCDDAQWHSTSNSIKIALSQQLSAESFSVGDALYLGERKLVIALRSSDIQTAEELIASVFPEFTHECFDIEDASAWTVIDLASAEAVDVFLMSTLQASVKRTEPSPV